MSPSPSLFTRTSIAARTVSTRLTSRCFGNCHFFLGHKYIRNVLIECFELQKLGSIWKLNAVYSRWLTKQDNYELHTTFLFKYIHSYQTCLRVYHSARIHTSNLQVRSLETGELLNVTEYTVKVKATDRGLATTLTHPYK